MTSSCNCPISNGYCEHGFTSRVINRFAWKLFNRSVPCEHSLGRALTFAFCLVLTLPEKLLGIDVFVCFVFVMNRLCLSVHLRLLSFVDF